MYAFISYDVFSVRTKCNDFFRMQKICYNIRYCLPYLADKVTLP